MRVQMENERLRASNSPSRGRQDPYGITPKHNDSDFYSNDSYVVNNDNTTLDSPKNGISWNPKTTKHSTNPRAGSQVKGRPVKQKPVSQNWVAPKRSKNTEMNTSNYQEEDWRDKLFSGIMKQSFGKRDDLSSQDEYEW